ncbi:MAG: chemotaxis-specific protein-glutamate methyltransferase CheB [Planctomycetota bacterium]
MRVLIVDDSAFMRKAIRTTLENDPEIEVVGNARDGEQAIDLAKALKPDLITLDIEMPGVDGLTALRRIMRECSTKVVIVSSLSTEGSQAALTALKLGAVEIIPKSGGTSAPRDAKNASDTSDHVLRVVQGLKNATPQTTASVTANASSSGGRAFKPSADTKLVVVGSATGGPPVVERLVAAAPADLEPAIVIAQHMPEVFTKSMAHRLASVCTRPVVHIDNGTVIEPGSIYICCGGTNTHLITKGATVTAKLSDEPESTIYYPSANVLFETASHYKPEQTLGIMLTGMGDDGRFGAKELVAKGGKVIAQSEETCVVYGMPKAVVEDNTATGTYSPEQIAKICAGLGSDKLRAAA